MPNSQSSGGLLSLAGKSLLTSAIIVFLLFQYLMGQLRIQAIEMKHMDPTDIVLTPFDFHRLTVYVAVVSVASGLLAVAKGVPFGSLCIQWISASGAIWALAVVCGASPTNHIRHTGLASLYVATLAVVLTALSATATTSPQQAWWQPRLSLPLLPTATSSKDIPTPQATQMFDQFNEEFLASCQMHMTLFVSVPFQVLRLYDWGSQIQRWPLPVVLGSTYGFVLGTILGLCATVAMHCNPKLREGYKYWALQSSGIVSNEKRTE